jgi:hypothetical protein
VSTPPPPPARYPGGARTRHDERAGVEHEYLLFPDEGHGLAKPENRLRFFAAAERFLARHLGGRAEDEAAAGAPA